MSSDHRSNPALSESSTSSSTSSRVSSPSIVAMSEFSNVAANSSNTSLVVPFEGTISDSPPSSIDGISMSALYSSPNDSTSVNEDASTTSESSDVDPQILEALRSKDRIYVLRLGEIMEELITEQKGRAELVASTSYQRLLLHRCISYYKLQIEVEPMSKAISAAVVTDSRIPSRRLADLVPPEPTPQPSFKIMQRSPHERRVKPQSHAGSVTGEDADFSDFEPSEAGSVGGRSSATGGSTSKKRMTMEEREAAYNEARSRIFNDKDKGDKDSSSISIASSSAGGSSVCDSEESVNSLATESERSSPPFNRKDSRRGSSMKTSGSRSLRSSAPPFASSGSGSSRNSRAPSPAFTYASLHEPAPSSSFEPHPSQQYPTPYPYPYSAPSQQNIPYPYMAPQPYYISYGQPPLMPPQNSPELPLSGEVYHPPPPPPPHMYNSYMWPGANQPPLHSAPPLQPQHPASNGPPHPYPHAPPQFMQHGPGYGYPMPGYFTPPGDHSMATLPHSGGQLFDERSVSVPLTAMGPHSSSSNGGPQGNNANLYNRPAVHPNGNPRPRTTPLSRPPWSYGPGASMGGAPLNGPVISSSNGNGETTGPRLHSIRRQSNTSNGSSSGAYRSSPNSDEVASTTSSSTSSSSRRTYTSNSSSQHPLPARPDWAVGLKPDPTLHATSRHHDHANNPRNMSPISPPRPLNGTAHSNNSPRRHQQVPPAMSLQSTDFPPLTSIPPPEKRPPAVGGAWTNPSRSVMLGPLNTQGNALVHHPNAYNNPMNHRESNSQSEDGFERPPPKATELYNPKVAKRSQANAQVQTQGDRSGSDGGLSEQARNMSLTDSPQTYSEPSLQLATPT